MDRGLDRLNSLPPTEAEIEFLKCCGAKNWARQMVDQRPFTSVGELLSRADSIWWSLEPTDWLKAFHSHPKIGEKQAAQPTSAEARAWSEKEQSGIRDAAQSSVQALAEGNRAYEQRFGYIFIVCATGKSSEEMLTILHERLNNDPDIELRRAAEELRKITQLRLVKLMNKQDS